MLVSLVDNFINVMEIQSGIYHPAPMQEAIGAKNICSAIFLVIGRKSQIFPVTALWIFC